MADMDLRLGRVGLEARGVYSGGGARYRPLGGARRAARGAAAGGAAAGVSPPRGRVRAVVACLGVRRAGLSPRAPGGGGEPRAARPRAPRLRPVFLWARQLDGAVQEVRCEDYDARNRIRIARTPRGWRVIPRTEIYNAIRLPPVPRRRRKRKRRTRPTASAASAASTAWSAPDLESHIPSHTIAIPRAPPEPTPLDNLLAVAELELSQQRTDSQFGFASEPAPPPLEMPFEPPPEPKPPDESFFAAESASVPGVEVEFATGDTTHEDLFETISEAHYLPELNGPHDEALLESLVEKGCEDNQILGQALDKLAHLVSGADYAEEEEDMLLGGAPVADIIDRLEQSLESPGRSSMTAAQGLLHLHHIADAPAYLEPSAFPPPDRPEPSADLEPASIHYQQLEDKRPEEMIPNADLYTDPVPDTHESYENNKSDNEPPLPDHIGSSSSEIPEEETKTEPCNEVDVKDPCTEICEQTEPDENMSEISTMDLVKELEESANIEELIPTDLSFKHPEKELEPIANESSNMEDDMSEKSDEQPKDLSVHRRLPTPHASPRRLDIPRAPSRESDAMQSPQPSGIPAVPSSPEIFTMPPSKRQSAFLETLLSSPSPKMYTSEVTITKHSQCEPLNLGKHRKSASPTVSSCSDEMKKLNKEFGESQEKRLKRESTEDLAKISKVFNKSCDEQLDAKVKKPEKLNISTDEISPIKQLQVLKSSSDFNIPDPLLVPKDKLNLILANPGREIPGLLIQRPELRLPEAFAFPAILQDPDILVISLAQLENILENDAKKQYLAKSKEMKQAGKSSADKPSTPQPDQATNAKPIPSMDALAGDIDAATSAALNQMLWLPYLSQLEAMAACSQNMDFLKALNSSGYTGQNYPELAQMFNPSAARFMGQGGFPMVPSMDYDNRLQFAMWQEAMNHANASQRPKPSMEAQMKEMASKSTSDVQNPYVHSTKNSQSKSHTSARTSPITHSYGNQRSMNHNPFLQGMYSGMNPNLRPQVPLPGLQIPYFNPNMMSSQRSPRTGQQKSPTSPYYHNNNYLQSKQSEAHQRSGSSSSQESPRPRISVKSLQNLMEPASSGSATGSRRGSTPQLGRRRDEPEVGSTTPGEPPHMPPHPHDPASFHLWHPLFGNQKSYHSPWSWTTVTATGD